VQISVVRPTELGPSEIATWHSMQRKTRSLASPFFCPEFAVAVGTFRRNARVAVLMEGSEIVGFFPFEKWRLGVGMPIGAGLNDSQGVIHAPAVEWDSRELLRACKLSVWEFDHLVEGQRPFEHSVDVLAPSPVIDLTEGFTAYQEKLQVKSPNFHKKLARKMRKLERNAGELRIELYSHDIAGLRSLMAWKSDQYRRTGWNDRFDRQWIVDLIDHFFNTRNDWFGGLLSLMYAGETLVSTTFGLRSGHVLAHWFAAYDTSFSGQSPGLIHLLHLTEAAPTLGVHLIELGKGTERYKHTTKSYDMFVGAGIAARGRLLSAAHRGRKGAVRFVGPHIRRHPLLFHAAEQVLRHYGRVY
jgi:CelD/BcsL family acetyltransferase involved in cellulose biosynthesis